MLAYCLQEDRVLIFRLDSQKLRAELASGLNQFSSCVDGNVAPGGTTKVETQISATNSGSAPAAQQSSSTNNDPGRSATSAAQHTGRQEGRGERIEPVSHENQTDHGPGISECESNLSCENSKEETDPKVWILERKLEVKCG
ncbi:unnamed protein product, partial [Amoebophrya sp. A120]